MGVVLPGFSLGLQLCHCMASPCMGEMKLSSDFSQEFRGRKISLSPEQFTSSLHLYGALVSAVHVAMKAAPFILRDV